MRPGVGTVLCLGEALVALTPPQGHSLETATELQVSPAGAEANVAVHLARVGVKARFAGVVGRDPFGRRLASSLRQAGVDVSALEADPDLPTGLYLKDPGGVGTQVYYYRSGSAITRLNRISAAAMLGVDHVHLSGITPALSAACLTLTRSLLEGPHSTSFDVNYRPAIWPVEEAGPLLLDLARQADLVLVGLDEAHRLWTTTTPQDVRSLLPDVELVVKDGPNAAHAYLDGDEAMVPAPQVTVVEPVGAGDAFAAGYLSARRSGDSLKASLRVGHALAANVLTSLHDQGGVLDPQLVSRARSGEGWPHTFITADPLKAD
jgi:2-dehydro-3-deoxygluconokinase